MVAQATLLPSTNGRRIGCTDSFHNLLRSVPSLWRLLPLIGYQPTYADKGEPQQLEMRNCSACNSTLCVEVQS